MKKVIALSALSLFALGVYAPVYAEKSTTDSTASSAAFLSCMQTAVGNREDAIISASAAFNTSMQSVLSARKTALVDAWKITDKTARNDARKKAWTQYRTDAKTAHSTLKNARAAAWTTFRADRIACGAPVTDSPALESIGVSL
jgi:hypothetical protein